MLTLLTPHDRRYLNIAMPAALESLFMILLASADLIMVGSLGTVAIAAVSIFLQPRLVVLCFSRSIAAAVTLMVSRVADEHHHEAAAAIMRQALSFGALFLGLLHLLFFLFLEDIFLLMGAEAEYLSDAMAYGQIAAIAVYISSLTLILQAMQLGCGDTASIMKTNVLGNIVNLIANALLIFGLGPFPALGVVGAAIGTVIGTLVTLAATIQAIRAKPFFIRRWLQLPDAAFLRAFLPQCASIFSEQGSERIGMVLFVRMVADLGTLPFAVYSICMNICDIYYDWALGMGKASMVLSGQADGRGDKALWRAYRDCGIKWSLVFSSLAFLIIFFFHQEIFRIYSSDPSAMALADTIMIIVALVSFPEAHAIVCAGILRGVGKTALVASYSFVLITIIRPLMTAFFLYGLMLGTFGAWLAVLLDQSARALCSGYLLHRWSRRHAP